MHIATCIVSCRFFFFFTGLLTQAGMSVKILQKNLLSTDSRFSPIFSKNQVAVKDFNLHINKDHILFAGFKQSVAPPQQPVLVSSTACFIVCERNRSDAAIFRTLCFSKLPTDLMRRCRQGSGHIYKNIRSGYICVCSCVHTLYMYMNNTYRHTERNLSFIFLAD